MLPPWIVEQVRRESALIKGAPLSFLIVCAISLTISWLFADYIYGFRLRAKDDLIASYREKLGIDAPTKSPYSSMRNAQIKQVAAGIVRELKHDWDLESSTVPTIENEAKMREWRNRVDAHYADLLSRYDSKYKTEALMLHDEMYSRLGNRAPQLLNQESRHFIIHPTNGIGLDMVADGLEILTKNLPPN